MIAILGDHRVDDHAIADQALVDDSCRSRSCDDAPVAAAATALFALDHQHEILGRLHIQLLALLVADDFGRLATVPATGLLRRARDDTFYPSQILGQGLPSRMPPSAPGLQWRRRRQRFTLAFDGNFQIADAGLLFQQLQLGVIELLAGRAVLLNPFESQPFFQQLNLQVGKLQLPLQLHYCPGIGGVDDRWRGSQHE